MKIYKHGFSFDTMQSLPLIDRERGVSDMADTVTCSCLGLPALNTRADLIRGHDLLYGYWCDKCANTGSLPIPFSEVLNNEL